MERVQEAHVFHPQPCTPTLDKEVLLHFAARWRDQIDARGRQATFSRERHMQVCWVLEQANYLLDEDTVQVALAAKTKEGASNRTVGKYLQAIKSFSKWLAGPKRRLLPFDPLSDLTPPNPRKDPRHIRTTFWPHLSKLLEATAASSRLFQGIPGADRAELYHAAACTGLREGTLMVVEVGQFRLDGPTPYVHVRADQVKDAAELTVPIQPDSAARLRAYLSGKMPNLPAFKTPRHNYSFARMLRSDLAEAGIPYCRRVPLGNGRSRREDVLDFHALRHTFGSWCASANVPLTTTQAWMGHSSAELTSRHYVHVIPADQAAAVAKLPPLPGVLRAS